MLKNYINIAFRNIFRNKVFSIINISGLAIGMTCAIIIFLWTRHELSYDKFNKNAKNICRVLIQYNNSGNYGIFTHGALVSSLQDEFPEIISSTRLYPIFPLERNPLRLDNNSFIASGSVADPEFFKIFSFHFIKGNPEQALSEPQSIVITEETAQKMFGKKDPMGETIMFELWHKWHEVKISGVINNIPVNSHIKYDFFIPSSLMLRFRNTINSWDDIYSPAYILLSENTPLEEISKKIKDIIKIHRPESKFTVHLQPLTKIHLHNYAGGGPVTNVYIFSTIGILILAIACINFMNLSLARSVKRAKEIGIRKIIGSSRMQLFKQFLGESILLSFLALNFAIILTALLIPVINNLLNIHLELHYSGFSFLIIVGAAIITGIISGCYPALFLSNFRTIRALKDKSFLLPANKKGSKYGMFKKFLVVIQFIISIILIVSATVANKQLKYIRNKDLGYNKEFIINMEMRGDFYENYEIIKHELLQNPDILFVTAANSSFLTDEKSTAIKNWEGKIDEEEIFMEIQPVDYNYLKTFDLKMVEGRFFSEDYSSDALEGVIVNEAAVKAMKMDSPIGKKFDCFVGYESRETKIIGIVKDFNFRSLHKEITPLFMVIAPWWYNEFYIKIRADHPDLPEIISFIEKKVKEIVPDYPFHYSFLEEDIGEIYKDDQYAGIFVKYGSFLAIFIACLGLFGLVSYNAEQRSKEIGIRKVQGANISNIVLMFSKEFTRWVIIAYIIACPIAFYIMNKWLSNFIYRINISWWVFVSAGIIIFIIALLTINYQVYKAATKNPVKSLRYE